MSEFKGTPAPWKIINDKDDTFFPSVVFSDTDDTRFGISKIVVNESHDKKMDSIRANALLISKAPELLEMLDVLNKTFKSACGQHPITLEVDELIKSATEI